MTDIPRYIDVACYAVDSDLHLDAWAAIDLNSEECTSVKLTNEQALRLLGAMEECFHAHGQSVPLRATLLGAGVDSLDD